MSCHKNEKIVVDRNNFENSPPWPKSLIAKIEEMQSKSKIIMSSILKTLQMYSGVLNLSNQKSMDM